MISWTKVWCGIGLGLVILYALASALPMYWMFSLAFQPAGGALSIPPHWLPIPFSVQNFQTVFSTVGFWAWVRNTVIVAIFLTAGALFFGSLGGYALSKGHFPGRELVFYALIATIAIPALVTFIPLYLLMYSFHWVNTYYGLIVPGLISPWAVFLFRQSFNTLPSSLLDAARMDACSPWKTFLRVAVPLNAPVFAVVGIFSFVWGWNDFFWPLLITNSTFMYTLQVGLAGFRFTYSTEYGPLLAGAALSAIPIIVVFFLFSRQFLRGITVGALKG